MTWQTEVEYTVVLVFPGFGDEQHNAEEIIEEAMEYLNTHKETPGFRFAPPVSAHLERVQDVEEAQEKLRTDDTVAMMILHGLEDEERIALTQECAALGVPVCRTTVPPEMPEYRPPPEPGQQRGWQVVFRKRTDDDEEPRAHTIVETTLTAPLEGDEEELVGRVQQLIAVMALGVMEHHWSNQERLH